MTGGKVDLCKRTHYLQVGVWNYKSDTIEADYMVDVQTLIRSFTIFVDPLPKENKFKMILYFANVYLTRNQTCEGSNSCSNKVEDMLMNM